MTGISRRQWLAGSGLAALFGAQPALGALAAESGTLPWRNWSGGVVAHPRGRFAPASENALIEFLQRTSMPLRPVGSGHSFTPLVPTDGQVVVIDELAGLLDHDASTRRATFGAGTRLGDAGAPLEGVGQAMFNLPDIDRQTLAGAIATATHGTGIQFKSLSGYVTALRLVTPGGEVLDVTAESNRALFDAARVSLGALGIVTRITMQNRAPYRLKQRSWMQKTEELLDDFDALAEQYRHFELFPYVHCDYSTALATDETTDAIDNPPPDPGEDAAFVELIRQLSLIPPGQRLPMMNAIAQQAEPSTRVDTSHRILANVRNVRFNEMEYSVPVEAGADCLREILRTIIHRQVDVVFPLEYRYVRRDDTWLGMSAGDHDHAAISIHRTASEDYRPYFDLIEPIFWKYQGRPHWGKIHSLSAAQLRRLYPRFREFQELRAELDPNGRMLNPHLRRLFGVPA